MKSVNSLIVFAHTLPRDMLPKCVETIVRLEKKASNDAGLTGLAQRIYFAAVKPRKVA